MLAGWRIDPRDSRQRHRTAVARGTVDRFDDTDVGQALDSRWLGRDVLNDEFRELRALGRDGVDGLVGDFFVLACALDLERGGALKVIRSFDAGGAVYN